VGAFDAIVDRYQPRLLGFCRQMLSSTEDAEDVLQEVFVNAFRAMRADNRDINLRPWLYRIARNRCLNHLRKPTADGQDSMDTVPIPEAASTHERVHNREEFRQLLGDVSRLPETQRSALLLREMDAMSYEDIAQSMDTTVPSVKSLLVRARISLAEASQARRLTCGEVQLELAEAAEGLRRVTAPARRHVRDCEQCGEFRSQVRSDAKALAALAPVGPLIALKAFLASKLGLGGGGAVGAGGAAGGVGGAGTIGAGAGSIGAGAGAASGAAGGLGVVGSAIGVKAVAGVVTAAVITAGAVEVNRQVGGHSAADPAPLAAKTIESSATPALATTGRPGLVIGTESSVPVETEAASEGTPPATEPVAATPDPATVPVDPATTVPVVPEPVTDPATPPPASTDGVSSESAALATGPLSPYQGGAATTVGDPASHPSPSPPGFSDPPSSSWNQPSSDPGSQPSGDPPTAQPSSNPPPAE
jgi:RNA polymerase sigma factor (sigma-70 family)